MADTAKSTLDTSQQLTVFPTIVFLAPSEVPPLTTSVGIYPMETSNFPQNSYVREMIPEHLTRTAYQISPSPTDLRTQSLPSIDTSVHVYSQRPGPSAISTASSEETPHKYDTSLNSSFVRKQNISKLSSSRTFEPADTNKNMINSSQSALVQRIENITLPSSDFDEQSSDTFGVKSSENSTQVSNVSYFISPSRSVDFQSCNTNLNTSFSSNVSKSLADPTEITVTVTVTSTVLYISGHDQNLVCTAASDVSISEFKIDHLQTRHHSKFEMSYSIIENENNNSPLDDYHVKSSIFQQGEDELSNTGKQGLVPKSVLRLHNQISTIMSHLVSETQQADVSANVSNSQAKDLIRSTTSDVLSSIDFSQSSVTTTEKINVTPTVIHPSAPLISLRNTYSEPNKPFSSTGIQQDISVSTLTQKIPSIPTQYLISESSKSSVYENYKLIPTDTLFGSDLVASASAFKSSGAFYTPTSSISTEQLNVKPADFFLGRDDKTHNETKVNTTCSNQTSLNSDIQGTNLSRTPSSVLSQDVDEKDNPSPECVEQNSNKSQTENVTEAPYYESLSSRILSTLYRLAINTLSSKEARNESTSKSWSTSTLENFEHFTGQYNVE